MALIFCDSFDHYNTAAMSQKWSTNPNTTIASTGRNGTNCLQSAVSGFTVTRTLPSSYTTLVAGVAFLTANNTTAIALFGFYEGSTSHVEVRLRTDGKFEVRNGNGTILGTSTSTCPSTAFIYLELKATIHDSTGSVVLRINGTTEINLTNQDTRNGGSGVINMFQFGGIGNGLDVRFDDLYILDTTGSAPNNDFLGDVRVQAVLPNGNGNSSQFVGSDSNSTDNYLLVDESTPNGDTDYVESATTTNKDTYAFGNVTPTSGTVYGVQVLASARKTDAGVRNIKLVARPGSTNYSSSGKALSTSYLYYSNIWEQNPDTSAAWTISEVNASEFGVEVA